MVNFIHECVGCRAMGFPCMGYSCKQGHIEFICDWCNQEADGLYKFDGDEVCEDCLLKSLEKREATEEEDETFLVNGEWLIDTEALGEFEHIDIWTL